MEKNYEFWDEISDKDWNKEWASEENWENYLKFGDEDESFYEFVENFKKN